VKFPLLLLTSIFFYHFWIWYITKALCWKFRSHCLNRKIHRIKGFG
jgi:hypothetical protein